MTTSPPTTALLPPELAMFEHWAFRAGLDGEDLWVAAPDVARILGYRMSSDMTRGLDEDVKDTRPVRTLGGEQETTVLTEAGLYQAIMQRQSGRIEDEQVRDRVRRFQRWVTHDVLPSIRRTGSYSTAPALSEDEIVHQALQITARKVEALTARVAELEPSARAFDAMVSDTAGDWSMRDAAQVLSRDPGITIGQNRLARLLRSLGWIDKRGIPYQHQVDTGRISARAQTRVSHRTGERVACDPQVRITAKGLAWLHRHLGGTEPLDTVTPTLAVVS